MKFKYSEQINIVQKIEKKKRKKKSTSIRSNCQLHTIHIFSNTTVNFASNDSESFLSNITPMHNRAHDLDVDRNYIIRVLSPVITAVLILDL